MKAANLTIYLLGTLAILAWLARGINYRYPCESDLVVPHRMRGDCG